MTRLVLWVAGVFLTTLLPGCGSPPETADLILTHARVIDGTGAVYEDATIAITGDRIQTITDAQTPFKATVTIDAEGKTVLPGLIDTHIHLGVGDAVDEDSPAEFLNNGLPANLQEYLSHGVTTIKSTGDIAEPYLKVRARVPPLLTFNHLELRDAARRGRKPHFLHPIRTLNTPMATVP